MLTLRIPAQYDTGGTFFMWRTLLVAACTHLENNPLACLSEGTLMATGVDAVGFWAPLERNFLRENHAQTVPESHKITPK